MPVAGALVVGLVALLAAGPCAAEGGCVPAAGAPFRWDGALTSVLFDPADAGRVLVGAANGSLLLVDWRTGAVRQRFLGHGAAVASLAAAPCGARQFASASDDGTVMLWSLAANPPAVAEPLRTFRGHTGPVRRVAWPACGTEAASTLFSAGEDGLLNAWDPADDSAPLRSNSTWLPLTTARFLYRSPGAYITARNGHVLLFQGGQLQATFVGHDSPVVALAASRSNPTLFLSGARDGDVRVWSVGGGAGRLVASHGGTLRDAAFNPCDESVVATANASAVVLWDVSAGRPQLSLPGATLVKFSPANCGLLYTLSGTALSLWDTIAGKRLDEFATGPIADFDPSPANPNEFLTCDTQAVRLWNTNSGTSEVVAEGEFSQVAFVPEGSTFLALGASDLTLRNASGDVLARWAGLRSASVRALRVNPANGSEFLALGAHAVTLGIITSPDLTGVRPTAAPLLALSAMVRGQGADGDLITGSRDGDVALWGGGAAVTTAAAQAAAARDAWVVRPDSDRFLTAGGDGRVREWCFGCEVPLARAYDTGDAESVNAVRADPLGRYVVAGGGAGAVAVWDRGPDGQRVDCTAGSGPAVLGVDVANADDGTGIAIAAVAADGSLRFWTCFASDSPPPSPPPPGGSPVVPVLIGALGAVLLVVAGGLFLRVHRRSARSVAATASTPLLAISVPSDSATAARASRHRVVSPSPADPPFCAVAGPLPDLLAAAEPAGSFEAAVQALAELPELSAHVQAGMARQCLGAAQRHQGLSLDEAAALRLCTLDVPVYALLDRALRTAAAARRPLGSPFVRLASLLWRALGRLPPAEQTVYHGLRWRAALTEGSVITFPGFLSCAPKSALLGLTQCLGTDSERTVLCLALSGGGADVTAFSAAGEAEVLLRPGARFLVGACVDHGMGLWEVQLTEFEEEAGRAPLTV